MTDKPYFGDKSQGLFPGNRPSRYVLVPIPNPQARRDVAGLRPKSGIEMHHLEAEAEQNDGFVVIDDIFAGGVIRIPIEEIRQAAGEAVGVMIDLIPDRIPPISREVLHQRIQRRGGTVM